MKTRSHTTTKRSVSLILILSLLLAASLACSFGTGEPTPMPTPVPPTATFTPLPTSTATSVPPTATLAPSPTAISGSFEPFIVNNIQLQIDLVEFGKPYKGMFAPASMTEDQTVLTIEVNVPADVSVDTVSNMGVWIVDENNVRYEMGTALSHDQPKLQVVWLFAVAKTAKSFFLHFPSGENIDITPLLH